MIGEAIFGTSLLILLLLMFISWRTKFNPWTAMLHHLDEAKSCRQAELETLQGFHERLKNVTNELLAKASEMDQESKLLANEMPAYWAEGLGLTCNQLVILADQTKTIDRYLQKRNCAGARHLLLDSCTLASKSGKHIKWLRLHVQKRAIEQARQTKTSSN